MPGPRSIASSSMHGVLVATQRLQQQLAAARVAHEVGGQFGGDDARPRRPASLSRSSPASARHRASRAPHFADRGSKSPTRGTARRCMRPRHHFHRAMVTRVPPPASLSNVELVDQASWRPRGPGPGPARGPAVGHRQVEIRECPGPGRRTAAAGRGAPSVERLSQSMRAAAAVDQRVARQLAGRGHHLGLVDQREAAAPAASLRTAWRASTMSCSTRSGSVSACGDRVIVRVRVVGALAAAPCRARR